MPVIIGAKPQSNFTDPIGLLTDCHRRIERFLAALARIATDATGGELTSDQRTSLDTALKYFREAAPKHTADEEKTLFPRMRACHTPEIDAVLGKVESLEHDHERADAAHAEVDRLGQAWLAAGSLDAADAARMRTLLEELTALYRDHIALEEGEVFPRAAAALGEAERKAMGSEMAARRGALTQFGARDLTEPRP